MIQLNKNSGIRNALVELPERVVFFGDTVCSEVVFDPRIKFFYTNISMDVWMKPYLRYRNQPRFRVPRTIRDFFLGIKDRFPVCCILHFCWDTFWNVGDRASRRGIRYTKSDTPYVPCIYHSSFQKASRDETEGNQ